MRRAPPSLLLLSLLSLAAGCCCNPAPPPGSGSSPGSGGAASPAAPPPAVTESGPAAAAPSPQAAAADPAGPGSPGATDEEAGGTVAAAAATASADRAATTDRAVPAAAAAARLVLRSPGAPAALPPPEDLAGPPADALRTASGLASRVLRPAPRGRPRPRLDDAVRVHYTGWTADGQMFDSTVIRGEPVRFPLRSVVPGLAEGLQQMAPGEKRRLWLPAELAYHGRSGKPLPGREAGDRGMLVFDVELLAVQPAPEAPADVAAPPASARHTPSGLAYRVLARGKGTRHPGPGSRVKVEYTAWTGDGALFDSTVLQGEPAVFALDGVVPAWAEALRQMAVGERRRLWFPPPLAEGLRSPALLPTGTTDSKGTLVFDVKLIAILD